MVTEEDYLMQMSLQLPDNFTPDLGMSLPQSKD
jgi:hypothetical protein